MTAWQRLGVAGLILAALLGSALVGASYRAYATAEKESRKRAALAEMRIVQAVAEAFEARAGRLPSGIDELWSQALDDRSVQWVPGSDVLRLKGDTLLDIRPSAAGRFDVRACVRNRSGVLEEWLVMHSDGTVEVTD
jgi:hypothetical protein